MKRLFAACARGAGRLVFWRRQPALAAGLHDAAAPEQGEPLPAAAVVPATGWLARLQHAWRLRRKPAPADPGSANVAEPAPQTSEHAETDTQLATAPSLLARCKALFRRQPKATADEAGPEAGQEASAAASSDVDPEAADEVVPAGGSGRVRALLSNKWVWVSAAGGIVLVLLGAMLFMLVLSSQEKTALQAELQKTRKQLDQQVAAAKKPAAVAAPAASAAEPAVEQAKAGQPAADTVKLARAKPDPKSSLATGECVITDQASVAANLRNCIEGFNRLSE